MNITLIGMSGVGKSSVGKVLAEQLGYNFIDIDRVLEKKFGEEKLSGVMEKLGEEAFLKIEEEAIVDLKLSGENIISPGGSLIYEPKAIEKLKSESKLIFFDLPFEQLIKNVKNPEERGIIGLKGKTFEELFKERHPLYKKYADIILDLSYIDIDQPEHENRQKVINQIKEELGL